MLIAGLMAGAYSSASIIPSEVINYPSIFAFGLVAYGFLCMGPVNIAVDSYVPRTDNAQSIFELSQIENIPGIKGDIKKNFGFEPDFELGKFYLESKRRRREHLQGDRQAGSYRTAVVGRYDHDLLDHPPASKQEHASGPTHRTRRFFSAHLRRRGHLLVLRASMQRVTTVRISRAVEFIKKNMNLDKAEADIEELQNRRLKICTQYAQKGMWNIFIALMSITLAFALLNPNFFVAYLISIALLWPFPRPSTWQTPVAPGINAKKVVEVDLKAKNTDLHAATVIGDTVGDPFKDYLLRQPESDHQFSTRSAVWQRKIAIEMAVHARDTEPIRLTSRRIFPFHSSS